MIVRPEQPDEESRARTHLANERTFLAWFRTGITLIALGLAAAQFLTLESSGGFPIVHVLATILVLTGIALALTGAARYLVGPRADRGHGLPARLPLDPRDDGRRGHRGADRDRVRLARPADALRRRSPCRRNPRCPVLSRDALNRATLARQHLLRRGRLDVVEAAAAVGGLQAQEPASPYLALWTRLEGFDAAEMTRAFEDRRLVKAGLMRATLHAVPAEDYLRLRPAVEPVFSASSRLMRGLRPDAERLARLRAEIEALAATPRPNNELRDRLAEVEGVDDAEAREALWWWVRRTTPLIQAPSGGPWSFGRRPLMVAPEAWLGADVRDRGGRPGAAGPALSRGPRARDRRRTSRRGRGSPSCGSARPSRRSMPPASCGTGVTSAAASSSTSWTRRGRAPMSTRRPACCRCGTGSCSATPTGRG